IKAFKTIADTIIDFVSQVEEFQKKLWEKKKFVLNTEWVITIDKLVSFVGKEDAQPFLEEVLKTDDQLGEWKEYFGNQIFEDWDNIEVKDLVVKRKNKQGKLGFGKKKRWKKLLIDTKYFDHSFKERLLNILSEYMDLEAALDGVVSETDNYQGLNLMKEKFHEMVNTIYIDPPYNTG